MTIPATPSQVTYLGDGSSVAFSIPFVFDTSADIKVIKTSSAGLPSELSTGFSITGGGGSTGTCTMSVAPASGETLTILDDPDLTQPVDYLSNDSFPAETHEAALDRLARQIKRLHQRADRSIRVADGDLIDGDNNLLPISSARAGKFAAYDASGRPTVAAGTGTDSSLRTDLANGASGPGSDLVAHPRTATEISNGVTPIDYRRNAIPILDASRFLSDNTGASDQSARLLDAMKSTRRILIPEGTYLLNSEVVIPRFPLDIEGAVECNASGGAILLLGTAAGAGAAALRTTAANEGLNLSRLKFKFQTFNTGQMALRLGPDFRYSTFERLDIEGSVTAGNTVLGIVFDGTGTYSAFNRIIGCKTRALLTHIDLRLINTVVDIRDHAFVAGISGATSYGLKCAPASSYEVSGGHIEGFASASSRGIFSQGAYQVQRDIRYENNVVNWEWQRGAGNPRIWGRASGERFISGGNPVYPVNDIDACMVDTGPGVADWDTMSLNVRRGYLERGRGTANGIGTDQAYNAGDFLAATGSWTVDALDLKLHRYRFLSGKMVQWDCIIETSSTSTTPAFLQILLPSSLSAVANKRIRCYATEAGTNVDCIAVIDTTVSSGTVVRISKLSGANFAAATNNLSVNLAIEFEHT